MRGFGVAHAVQSTMEKGRAAKLKVRAITSGGEMPCKLSEIASGGWPFVDVQYVKFVRRGEKGEEKENCC